MGTYMQSVCLRWVVIDIAEVERNHYLLKNIRKQHWQQVNSIQGTIQLKIFTGQKFLPTQLHSVYMYPCIATEYIFAYVVKIIIGSMIS